MSAERDLLEWTERLADMLNAIGMPETSGEYAGVLREKMAEIVASYKRLRAIRAANEAAGLPREGE